MMVISEHGRLKRVTMTRVHFISVKGFPRNDADNSFIDRVILLQKLSVIITTERSKY